MRILNIVGCLLQRGTLRRNLIMQVFYQNPERKFTCKDIQLAISSWAGVVHADLVELHRGGYIHRSKHAGGPFLYWYNESGPYAPHPEPHMFRGRLT